MEEQPKIFYRFIYEAATNGEFSNAALILKKYILKRETLAGYWIGYESFDEPFKWISKTSKKRFAYPTKQEALTNYIKRTTRRKMILNHQINGCDEGLSFAKSIKL